MRSDVLQDIPEWFLKRNASPMPLDGYGSFFYHVAIMG